MLKKLWGLIARFNATYFPQAPRVFFSHFLTVLAVDSWPLWYAGIPLVMKISVPFFMVLKNVVRIFMVKQTGNGTCLKSAENVKIQT